MKSRLHDLELYLHHETQPGDDEHGAIKVSLEGEDDEAVWLPKSACQVEHKSDRIVVVTAQERLFFEKGLI